MTAAHRVRTALAVWTLLCGIAGDALATEAITDEGHFASQTAYTSLETRLQRLSEAGRPQADYTLAKAQCWLDVSFHEYSRNNRSAFVAQALSESRRLIESMENPSAGSTHAFADDTPPVRQDLWTKLQLLKEPADWHCAAAKLACAEVELVHAAHAYAEAGWRHAAPYVQIAEEDIVDAQAQSARCVSKGEPAETIPVRPPATAESPSKATIVLSTDALFRSNDARLTGQAQGVASLDALIGRLKTVYSTLTRVTLIGHSDELLTHHTADYNVALSRRRAQAVADYLVAHGIAIETIVVQGRGTLDPLARCPQTSDRARRIACLAPNRRVEVVVEGVRKTS